MTTAYKQIDNILEEKLPEESSHDEQKDIHSSIVVSKSVPKPLGNKKVLKQSTKFCDFVLNNINKNFIIINHDFPDCDSIASSFGISIILQFLGVSDSNIRLVYDKEISHPQNRALVNVLNIPLKKWNSSMEQYYNADNNCVFVYVDCLPANKNVSINMPASIIIDHHEKTIQLSNNIIFIHSEVGACSTLITDLMLTIPPQGEDPNISYCFSTGQEEIQDLCTALAIGIKVDTHDFADTSELDSDIDFRAYKILTANMTKEKFTRINNYELPKYLMEYERISWNDRTEQGDTFISGIGKIPESHSNCLAYLCDKYLRMPGIQTVLIYAIVGNSIQASIRTISSSVSTVDLCDTFFGEGNGGSKPSQGVGGARVELNPIFHWDDMPEEDQRALWNIIKNRVEAKFANIATQYK